MAYSGHSFCCGAATWAVSNGINDDTIYDLGRWHSDCFHHYIDKSATNRAATNRAATTKAATIKAATIKAALYTNTSAPLHLDVAAWCNF